jgi:hypothetical protein
VRARRRPTLLSEGRDRVAPHSPSLYRLYNFTRACQAPCPSRRVRVRERLVGCIAVLMVLVRFEPFILTRWRVGSGFAARP